VRVCLRELLLASQASQLGADQKCIIKSQLYYRHMQLFSDGCRATEWRIPIRCLKLQVLFRKRATNCRALLRKTTYKDKASYGSSPPCMRWYENLV